MTSVTAVFASAARSFASLVRDIPADRWDGPGLGDWDLRALVSHTSRSLVTVISYLQVTAEHEDVTSGQEYYAWVRDYVRTAGRDAIVERGRQAGRELGEDPVAAIDALVERVLGELTTVGDPLIAVIGGLGIRLSVYLRTRTFELAVHSLDVARAADVPFALPNEVLEDAVVLAARIGLALGQGEPMLLALTGRTHLPELFSVV